MCINKQQLVFLTFTYKKTNDRHTLLFCFRKNSQAIIVATRAPTIMLMAADTPSATALTCWTLLTTGTWTFRHDNETAEVTVVGHAEVTDMILNTNIRQNRSSTFICNLIYCQQLETSSNSKVKKLLSYSATYEISQQQVHVNKDRNECVHCTSNILGCILHLLWKWYCTLCEK